MGTIALDTDVVNPQVVKVGKTYDRKVVNLSSIQGLTEDYSLGDSHSQ